MKGKGKIVMVGKIGKKGKIGCHYFFSPNETPGNKGKIGKKGNISYQLYFFSKWDT